MLRTVLAPNPSPMTLDGTRTYIVGRTEPVVIDPGPAEPSHLRGIEERLNGARPAAILLTHAHADHAAGAHELAVRTGAPLCMAAGALQLPWGAEQVDRWLEDGDRVVCDGGAVRAVATPGHAPEHLAFLWSGGAAPGRGALFVGDLLMGEGNTTLVAPPEGDLAAYLRSLEKVRDLGAEVLYPAHGPSLEEPRRVVERYLAHRRERIQQLRAALRENPSAELPELVEVVYGADLDPRLVPAAEGSLYALLEYLERMPGT